MNCKDCCYGVWNAEDISFECGLKAEEFDRCPNLMDEEE